MRARTLRCLSAGWYVHVPRRQVKVYSELFSRGCCHFGLTGRFAENHNYSRTVEALRLFRDLNRVQRHTFLACFLGWTLDAFDFFLLTFVIAPMARDFGTSIA